MDIWVFWSVLSKFGLYVGALFSVGIFFYQQIFETADALKAEPMRIFALGMTILGLCAFVLGYGVQAARLTGDVSAIFDSTRVLKILLLSPAGLALMFQAFGFAFLLIEHAFTSYQNRMGIAGSLVMLASFTQVGHVTNVTEIAQILLFVHLAFLALWLGILWPLYRLSTSTQHIATVARMAQSFGMWAMIFVPVVIVAGVGLGYLLSGSWSNIMTTAYGQTLILKIILVTVLLALAAVNKWYLVPRIAAGNYSALRYFHYSVLLEILIVLAVLLTTAVLTSLLEPPM